MLVFLSNVVFGPHPGVCENSAATVLAVAFAVGTGVGFLGSEAATKVKGDEIFPGLGKKVALSLAGGIAAFAVAAAIGDQIVERNCKAPRPTPCSQYAADGVTCTRCVMPVSFGGIANGSRAVTASCKKMAPGNSVKIEYIGIVRVEQKTHGGRQANFELRSNGKTIGKLPQSLIDDVYLLQLQRLSGDARADKKGTAEASLWFTSCFYDRFDERLGGPFEGTCAADFSYLDIRSE